MRQIAADDAPSFDSLLRLVRRTTDLLGQDVGQWYRASLARPLATAGLGATPTGLRARTPGMTPRELLATAAIPGGDELRLFRRGGDFMIVLDRNELMSSRMSGSEEALATMTCERLRGAPRRTC